jgi:hypothetical protein
MEQDLSNVMKSKIRDNWIVLIDKKFNVIVKCDPYYSKEIIILYEPDVTSIDFRSIFNKTFDGYPISIENYIKKKLRRFDLIHYVPILERCIDPIGLNQSMFKVYLKYHKFNEFERDIHAEWELFVSSGLVDKNASELSRQLGTSCIIHTDRSSTKIVRHEKIFYTRFKKNEMSIFEWIVFKLRNCGAIYFSPYCEYINDPRGLDTQVFVFGITRDKSKLSPRFNKSFKSSK